jgi:tetratricopeptide (TPR) repeat protein
MLRGRLHEVAGEHDKAIADYQKVLEIDPDDEIVRNALGRLGGALPDSARLPPGACSANDISHEERIAGCTAVIESGQATGWTLKTAYCNRGYALTELGEYDRVIVDSDAAIRLDDKLACAYLNRGRAWYYKHDLDRAIADYTQAVKSDGRLHEAYASRGTAYFDRRDFTHAIADYDMAIAIDPSVAMYISDRGNTRLQMGEKEAAIADFSRAIEVDPNYAAAYIRRGRAFLASDELERAEADFAKALQLAPGDSEAQSGRTAVLERRNPAQAAAEKEAEHRAGFERLRNLVDQQHGKSAP